MHDLKPLTRRHAPWLLAAIVLVALLLAAMRAPIETQGFQLKTPQGSVFSVDMPMTRETWGRGAYSLSGELLLSPFSARRIHIVPDDEVVALRVNGEPVDLNQIPESARRDVQRGFIVDLGQSLKTGKNTIAVDFRDYGGNVGMHLRGSLLDTRILALGLLITVLSAFIFFQILVAIARIPIGRAVLYFLIATASVVQVWYIFTYNPVNHIWSDPARHWEQGLDVLRVDLMSATDPVGYQVFIAVLGKLTLKNAELVAYFTSLLALLGPWCWYRFFRELQGSKTVALAGWAILSWLPSWTAIYGYFMQETLMLPLLGAALWATWRCRRKGDLRNFVFMVLLWILVGLTRGIAIPLAAVCCTWLWLAQDEKLKKAFYSSLVLLLIMGPLTWRSYVTVNHFAPHGMGYLNVIYAQSGKQIIEILSEREGGRWVHGFGSPSTGAEPLAPFSDWKTRRNGKVRIKVDLDEGKRDWEAAAENIEMSWRDYFWITGENLIFLFVAESWPDNNMARLIDRAGSVLRWVWAPLFVFLIIVLLVNRRKMAGHWMLPSMLAAWFVVQALIPISVNEGRYRKPFEGLATAQVILWIAAVRGFARPAAPAPPLPGLDVLRQRLARRKNPGVQEEVDDVR